MRQMRLIEGAGFVGGVECRHGSRGAAVECELTFFTILQAEL